MCWAFQPECRSLGASRGTYASAPPSKHERDTARNASQVLKSLHLFLKQRVSTRTPTGPSPFLGFKHKLVKQDGTAAGNTEKAVDVNDQARAYRPIQVADWLDAFQCVAFYLCSPSRHPGPKQRTMLNYPEGASTQYLRTLVPKAIKGMAFGKRILKYWVLGPSGLVLLLGLVLRGRTADNDRDRFTTSTILK